MMYPTPQLLIIVAVITKRLTNFTEYSRQLWSRDADEGCNSLSFSGNHQVTAIS